MADLCTMCAEDIERLGSVCIYFNAGLNYSILLP